MKLKTHPHFSKNSFPTILVSLISFILIAAVFMTVHADAASKTPPSNGKHLVTIHDNNTTRGIVTNDSTLRQAFHDAHIPITDQDLIEPSLDSTLTANDYEVNVYRARPVTIVDGNIHRRVMSPYRTADQIVAHTGMKLHDEDRTTITTSRNIIDSGPGLVLTIDRATPFHFYINGEKTQAYTQGVTVRDMLKEKGISTDATLSVSVPLTQKITAGMVIRTWRDGKHTVTKREMVKFSVKQVQDADEPSGYHKITTSGKNGQKVVTYEVSIKGGKVVHEKAIQSIVTEKSVQQVEVIGTKNSLPAGSHTDWMRAAGMNPSNYGYINYIFSGESGWNPAAVNPSGYSGLGQTSQATLQGACGSAWASNPVCQIKVFDGYVHSHGYGTWANAAAHWRAAHSW